MSLDQAVAFVLFAIVAAGTPGPSNILLTSTGSRVGVRRGLPCLFGVAIGMGLLMFVAAIGLGNLVLGHPLIMHGLKWGGIGFLLRLSWQIATAGRGEAAASGGVVGFWGAASFQWVNPKSWLVSVSAVGAYVEPGAAGAAIQATYFGVLFALAALPGCFVWLAFGATVHRVLRTEKSARVFNVAMGLVLAGSIILLVR